MKKIILLLVMVVYCFSLSACGSMGTKGAMAGAATGAGIGQVIGQNTEATLIGSAIGFFLGYFGGNEMDKSQMQQQMQNMQHQRVYYPPAPQYRGSQQQIQYYNPRQ